MLKDYKMLAIAGAAAMLSACGGGGGGGGGDEEPPPAFVSCVGDVCTLTGVINENYTLTADKKWQLDPVRAVRVGEGNVTITTDAQVASIKAAGVTLTIEPGTDIRGSNNSSLIVTRGSKIVANGTAANPITFSSLDENFDGEGEWGGIVVQGFAPVFGGGGTGACFGVGTFCNIVGEGGPDVGVYGGNDKADNSGSLKYVRIAEAGLVAGLNNELNGLTLMGVGHGTTVDYIQVHNNLDDGVELFGGTVNIKHLVLTNNDDDDIDYDNGYQGNIQFAIVRKNQTKTAPSGSNDPRGIEANSSDAGFVPETNATLANVTILGGPVNNAADKLQPGALFRGAVTSALVNSAVKGFNTGCVRIQDAASGGSGTTVNQFSDITLTNVLGDCQSGFYVGSRVADAGSNASATAFDVDAAYALAVGSATLGGAVTIPAVNNGSGFAFESTDYVGAVKPGTSAANAWWAGWVVPGSL